MSNKRFFALQSGSRVSILALIIIHLAGIIGMHSSYKDLFLMLSPLNLIVSSILLFFYHKDFSKTFITFSLIVIISGFMIEVIGVYSGIIFGHYKYGNTLGIKLWNVPIIVGINWLMLVYCVGVICNRFSNFSSLLKSLLGAFLLVALDFFMEPVAVKYDFWSWNETTIPFQNYIAWYIVSFLLLFLFNSFNFKKENKLAVPLFIIQLIFFITLALF